MSLLFFYAESAPFWQGMATIAVMFIVSFVLIVIGGYVFVRIIAHVLNTYQNNWENSAKPLGLSVDKKAGGPYKPLVGERNGARISITHFSINPRTTSVGVVSVDHCALVEVMLTPPLDFSFRTYRRETFLEESVAQMVDESDQVGHEFFDHVFKTGCSDLGSLRSLLNVQIMDAESSTILTDLVLAAKKYVRVVLTDRSLSLGIEAEFGDSELIEPVIAKAIYLASRVQRAASL